jgi:hypothetical protein
MTESKTETATIGFRELDLAELERVSGGYIREVLLNPQPLPPRAASYHSTLSWVALNPQPEPPGIQFSREGSL